MDVIYTGTSDFQEFDPEDFKKAGIDQDKKVRFPRGEPREVSDEVGRALISEEGIFGDFPFSVPDDSDYEALSDEDEAGSRGVETNFPDGDPKGSTDDEDDELIDGDPVESAQLPAEGKEATTEGTATPTAGGGGPRSTGRGTSTGARGSGARGGRGTTGRGSSTGGES